MLLSERKYTNDEIIAGRRFLPYPELINDRWQPWATNDAGDLDREAPLPKRLPKGWQNFNPKSRRADLHHLIPKLSDDAKREIVANAQYREDFIDHDKTHSEEFFGCLCELVIYTGQQCEKHLVKGPNGEPIVTPNPHWCWGIDVAPRGYVCPVAYARWKQDTTKPVDGCEILLFNQGPSEAWVLAQEANEVPVRASQKSRAGVCPKCVGVTVDDTHRLHSDQRSRFEFQGIYEDKFKAPVLPMQYKPGGMNSVHALLKKDGWYHDLELSKFPGVKMKDVWIPHVGKGWIRDDEGKELVVEGITKEHWKGAQAHVNQVLEIPVDHVDFEEESLKVVDVRAVKT